MSEKEPTPKQRVMAELDRRARLSQAGAGGVVVKPLTWEQPDGPDGTAWLGHGTDWCQYYIRLDDDGTYLMPGDRQSSDDDDSAEEYRTLEEAQAAAQQDYQQRILSALAASPDSLHHVTGERITRKDLNEAYRKGMEDGRLATRLIDGMWPEAAAEPATPPAPVPTVSVEAVAALDRLEKACDGVAATRSQATYLAMIDNDNVEDALQELDHARRQAARSSSAPPSPRPRRKGCPLTIWRWIALLSP